MSMIETERKFLVKSTRFKEEASRAVEIVQGYLSTHPTRSVRVRLKGNKAFITIKGKTNQTGASRFEWEKEIPSDEAKALMELCESTIAKTRYLVPVGKHIFEVDEFHEKNTGLIIAEVELASEEENFIKPAWLGKEVTGEKQYYNAYLSQHSYRE